jgi:Trk K+ transport system NAD-binding subunit
LISHKEQVIIKVIENFITKPKTIIIIELVLKNKASIKIKTATKQSLENKVLSNFQMIPKTILLTN